MSDFDFNALDLRTTGRASKNFTFHKDSDLTVADLNLLSTERAIQPINLKKIRDRHHMLARALASGVPEGEAALMCNYTSARVSILKHSPVFKELMAFYRSDVDREYLDMHSRLAGVAMDAVEEISDRLEEAPQDFTLPQLLDVVKLGADRTGHGPSTKTTIDVKFGLAERLKAARDRTLQAIAPDVIDAEVTYS